MLTCWILAALLLIQAQAQPTFRSEVRLIVQPVTVTGRDGRPLARLTPADFVLTEDGKPQQIVFVEYQAIEAFGKSTVPPASAVPGVTAAASAPVPGDARFRGRRLLVLYFDLYRGTPDDQGRSLRGADTFLASSLGPADLVSIVVFDGRGVRVRHEFSDDPAALRATLATIALEVREAAGDAGARWDPGGAFGEDDDSFNLFSADRQLAALQTAVTDLGGLPEIKTLIYFGAGFTMAGSNLAQLRATINAAVRANVTLNPIDSRGLVAMAPMGDATQASPGGVDMFSGAIVQKSATNFQRSQDTLYALASDTGGKALLDNNDLASGVVQAAASVSGYYLVGYYTTNTASDGRFRRVKVTLKDGRDVKLAYRAGYYGNKVFARFNAADRERQLAEALKLEDPITEIPIAAEVNFFRLNAAEYFVPISIRLPGSELTRTGAAGEARVAIDVIGELKDEFGVTHRNVRDRVELAATARTIQYETAFTILPGRYAIKLLARNAVSGRIGTYQTWFTVPNLARERTSLPISSVVLSNHAVDESSALFNVKQKVSQSVANPLVANGVRIVPSVTRAFAGSVALSVFLQAYLDDAKPHPLVAFVTLYRGDSIVRETAPVSVADTPGAAVVPIRVTVPLDGLAFGPYLLQVSVLDPAGNRAAFRRASIVVR